MFELEIEREGIEYQVGDCTLLIRDRGVDSRPYSFSSHPDEPVLRFLIRALGDASGASFSRWLESLRPGEHVGVGTPFGWFRPGRSSQEVWFATGTGLSPFLSALRGRSPLRPLSLLVGVRDPSDAVLRPWLEDRAPVSWAFSRIRSDRSPRRVTDSVGEVPVGPEIGYFLCGNQRMIHEVAEGLQSRGVLASQIHEELFFR